VEVKLTANADMSGNRGERMRSLRIVNVLLGSIIERYMAI
jgi:hypothetical protein